MARKAPGPTPCPSDFADLFRQGGDLAWVCDLARDRRLQDKSLELSLNGTSTGGGRATLYAGNAVALRVEQPRGRSPRADLRKRGKNASYRSVADVFGLTRQKLLSAIDAIPENKIQGEGMVQASLLDSAYWDFTTIARQPNLPFSRDLASPINRARKHLYEEVKRDGGRWPGKSSIVGDRRRPDALAVDRQGRLLVIEAKWVKVRDSAKATVVPDLTRAPFQAAFSAALVRRWAARKYAVEAIRGLLEQRASLQPRGNATIRSWKPGSPVVSTVVLAGDESDIERVLPALEERYPRIQAALKAKNVDMDAFTTRVQRDRRPEILVD